jgi:hypothetical protein
METLNEARLKYEFITQLMVQRASTCSGSKSQFNLLRWLNRAVLIEKLRELLQFQSTPAAIIAIFIKLYK